jgi:LPS sulfotransferase NodH
VAARLAPEDGDIVLREEKREGVLIYVLHTASGADQYLVRTREEAVAQAVTFTRREQVRAWLIDEGYDFTLVEDFRVVGSV